MYYAQLGTTDNNILEFMEKRNSPNLSQELYHRIYRLLKRKIPVPLIAATIKLPIDTVQNIADRLAGKSPSEPEKSKQNHHQVSGYFDFSIMPRTTFTVIDCQGDLVESTIAEAKQKFDALMTGEYKSLALRMAKVTEIDASGIELLKSFHLQFCSNGRYAAILDPSANIDPLFVESRLEEKIAIFGTESAFEEKAARPDPVVKKKV